jgi:hypothetical protein
LTHRLFLLLALLWSQGSMAELRSPGNVRLSVADPKAPVETADHDKRREALRETLRAQDAQSRTDNSRQRSPQERAELREALRRHRESALPPAP